MSAVRHRIRGLRFRSKCSNTDVLVLDNTQETPFADKTLAVSSCLQFHAWQMRIQAMATLIHNGFGWVAGLKPIVRMWDLDLREREFSGRSFYGILVRIQLVSEKLSHGKTPKGQIDKRILLHILYSERTHLIGNEQVNQSLNFECLCVYLMFK